MPVLGRIAREESAKLFAAAVVDAVVADTRYLAHARECVPISWQNILAMPESLLRGGSGSLYVAVRVSASLGLWLPLQRGILGGGFSRPKTNRTSYFPT